ncbi:MAG TPA: glycerol kinase [Solirubrobacteraceae bacterium]|nr:glycerol kinase [Solirubrobacteraceae bacterium]
MSEQYVLVIDEGTTGTRAVIVDRASRIKGQAYREFTQYNPAPDRVEHDPEEIWQASLAVIDGALQESGLTLRDIAAIGISNQRATTVVWNRTTGEPVTPAIVWQDTRTADYIESIRDDWAEKAYARTGWALAPVYSSLSLRWILEHVPGAQTRADSGELAFGTIDSWLIHRLTGGRTHAIAASNASVTGSYDLLADDWYEDWLSFLGIPLSLFPEVRDDSGDFGATDPDVLGASIPITGAIADQHAALFAQGCVEPGSVKCTHGTGTFLDMNIGSEVTISGHGLNTLIAWRRGGLTTYGLEGYAAVTGSAVQWLRDGAGLIADSAETGELAMSVPDNGGVYFVPALTGLSAPYWDSYARGMIIGITRGTTRAHLARATLEGIVFAIKDFLETMREDSGVPITSIKVDGGAARNDFLLQFQADMLDAEVVRPRNAEATSLGAAYMAGLATGYWPSLEACLEGQGVERVFLPHMDHELRDQLYADWTEAVHRCMGWASERRSDATVRAA